ncbi:MAG: response regulator [Rhodobacteraceae bacterium]|nr:MAG: response regulator [Paracoccaceae bacterium]
MLIAVVEDNEVILSVLLSTLEVIDGCVVHGFDSVGGAFAGCEDHLFDLMIFDYRLPDGNGIDAIRKLRAKERYRHVPLVMLTGDNDIAVRLDAIRAGATDFLTKPVNIEELRLRVGNLLAMRRAQCAAAEREALLDAVIEASTASIAIGDATQPETPLIYVNAAFERLSGYSRKEVLAQNCRFLNAEPPGAQVRDDLRRTVAGRLAGQFRLRNRRRHGEEFWNQLDLRPVPGPGADARYIVATQFDISREVEARNSRDRIDARLSDIAQLSAAWFFELDSDLRLVYVSRAVSDALSTTPQELYGLTFEQIGGKIVIDEGRGPASLHERLLPRKALSNLPVMVTLPDQSVLWVQTSVIPFYTTSGAFEGFRGFGSDVSEIVAARDAARQAERAKSSFLAMMGHELQTPITAISGLAELLESVENPAERQAHLATIRDAAGRLSSVFSDVLDQVQIESGQLTLAQSPFSMVALCEEVRTLFSTAAEAKSLALTLSVTGQGGAYRIGDPVRVRQILKNLVCNAIKFTEAGSIEIRLDLTTADALQVEVADTGIGLADAERIFAAFVQLDDGIARRSEGSGLGLSITRGLITAMQGEISVSSRIGAGATFRFSLPLPACDAVLPAERPQKISLQRRHILVADDNHANRKILSMILERLGAAVTVCEDGAEALEIWEPHRFDALLLDINMPRLAGTDVMREIRHREAAGDLPRIFACAVSANARPEQVAGYLDAGFDDCIAKPIGRDNIAAMLSWLDTTSLSEPSMREPQAS